MSKYTTLLRWPIENRLDELELSHTEQNWPQVYGFLGLDDYPIFDELYRQTLNDKIIRRYYMREIGFETVGLFVWNLRTHMHEIMPYYNELYKTLNIIDDPLYTRDMSFKETWDRDESESSTGERSGEESSSTDASEDVTTNGTSKSAASDASESKSHEDANQSASSSDRNVFQDTPMNGLDTGAIQAMDYATNVTFDDGSTSSESERDTTGSTTTNRTETGETSETRGTSSHSDTDGTSHESTTDARTGRFDGSREHRETGYDRPQSELLLTYRKTLVNIDLMIVDSCASLFMGLW